MRTEGWQSQGAFYSGADVGRGLGFAGKGEIDGEGGRRALPGLLAGAGR
jgi:hypothetical protein